MLNARFMLEEPEKVEATMEITMTVGEWEQLKEQLQRAWPASHLSSTISDLLIQAREKIYPSKEIKNEKET